jgi:hypothetical protein
MLNGRTRREVEKRNNRAPKTPLSISTGLKSTAEAYFGHPLAVPFDGSISKENPSQKGKENYREIGGGPGPFAVSARDLATYRRYAAATDQAMLARADQVQGQWSAALLANIQRRETEQQTKKPPSPLLQRSATTHSPQAMAKRGLSRSFLFYVVIILY